MLRLDPSQPAATQLVYSTLFTDNEWSGVLDLKLLGDGRIAGAGYTGSGSVTTCGAYDSSFNGNQDGFVFLLDPRGQGVSDLLYSSVVGGTGYDFGVECALASTSPTVRLFVGGYTDSSDHPTTPGAFQTVAPGGNNGAVYLIELAPQVTRYCSTSPNSAGAGALIAANGTLSVSANNFSLVASKAPPNKPGLFIYSASQAQAPFGNGSLCLGTPIFRLDPPVPTNAFGTAVRSIDFNSPPNPNAAILPGSAWNFQFWYRDPAGGGARFNLSDAFQATFCP